MDVRPGRWFAVASSLEGRGFPFRFRFVMWLHASGCPDSRGIAHPIKGTHSEMLRRPICHPWNVIRVGDLGIGLDYYKTNQDFRP